MLPSVIFSPDAMQDLEGIFEYIAHDSPYYAGQVVDDVYARTKILLIHALSGRVIPGRLR